MRDLYGMKDCVRQIISEKEPTVVGSSGANGGGSSGSLRDVFKEQHTEAVVASEKCHHLDYLCSYLTLVQNHNYLRTDTL